MKGGDDLRIISVDKAFYPVQALKKERDELTAFLDDALNNAKMNIPESVNMAVFDRLRVINRELRKLSEDYYGKKDQTNTDR